MISDKGPNNKEVVEALCQIQKQGSSKLKKYKQMGLDKFEKNLMERIEQEKEAERDRMLRDLQPNKNQMKKREMKVANKSELSELASRRSCSQQTQQLNESKLGKFDLDESLTSIKKNEKHINKN